MKGDVDKVKVRWYQILGFLATGTSLYFMEN